MSFRETSVKEMMDSKCPSAHLPESLSFKQLDCMLTFFKVQITSLDKKKKSQNGIFLLVGRKMNPKANVLLSLVNHTLVVGKSETMV